MTAPAALADPLPREPGWRAALAPTLASPGVAALCELLRREVAAGQEVYPPVGQVFAAFERTPLDCVRVVIVGQDPYHGAGQAMGLSFSVPRGVRVPPSLRNMFTEIEQELGIPRPEHGDLTAWADGGVLLLNSSLTVRAGEAGSHAGVGWEPLTDAAIRAVSRQDRPVVFLLWGRHAQEKSALVDEDRHLVLRAAHPSPLSARRGFFGCGHFIRANQWLVQQGRDPVDWSLPA